MRGRDDRCDCLCTNGILGMERVRREWTVAIHGVAHVTEPKGIIARRRLPSLAHFTSDEALELSALSVVDSLVRLMVIFGAHRIGVSGGLCVAGSRSGSRPGR